MSTVIRFIPGVLAAICGYIALWLVDLFNFDSRVTGFVLFLAVYLIVAVLADKAMKTYGR